MGRFSYQGLNDNEVRVSREKHGANELPSPEPESFMSKLLENFQDPLIKILLVALVITLLLSFFGYADWIEAIGIGVAVFLATFVSTYSEFKNEQQFQELQLQASRILNNVFRNGSLDSIMVGDVVVGDLVMLEAGDRVPADGHIIAGEILANQATLTGEPRAERKIHTTESYTPVQKDDFMDQHLVFRGSVIDEGEAVMRIDFVGKQTVYGGLSVELATTDERESPLQVKLSALADAISKFGYIGAVLIFFSFLFKQFVMDTGYSWQATVTYITNWAVALHDVTTSLILAIIVIVVAVPEGLPMMIAIVLSMNMRKLLRAQVLVRKLLGIETAGSMNILFVDKTGTLTRGIFQPQMFIASSGDPYRDCATIPPALRSILGFTVRESTTSVVGTGGKIAGGNASDRALLEFLDRDQLTRHDDVQVLNEILFNSTRKFSAVELKVGANTRTSLPQGFVTSASQICIVKGAPELILSNTKSAYNTNGDLIPFDGQVLLDEINRLSQQEMRVIAIAASKSALKGSDIPSALNLVGIIGVKDEVRKESRPALKEAREAGIHVVMITGDRRETALAVAQEIGLYRDENDLVLDSDELTVRINDICPLFSDDSCE